MHAVSSHLRLPRIVSGPDKLVIDKSKGDVTLNWKFKLRAYRDMEQYYSRSGFRCLEASRIPRKEVGGYQQ